MSFTVASTNMKYLEINLMKDMEDLYMENFKTLLRETKDLKERRDMPCSWLGRLNIVKMLTFPRLIYRFNVIPVIITAID